MFKGIYRIFRPQALLLAVILSACSTAPDIEAPSPADEASLTNTYWKLKEIGDKPVPDREKAREPHLIFLDDGRVLGHTGCNTLSGQYGVAGGQVRFTAMAATRMACPDFTAVESAFIQAMDKTRGMVIEGQRLRLVAQNSAVLAVMAATRHR